MSRYMDTAPMRQEVDTGTVPATPAMVRVC
jgi:hypothetical protein